MRANRGLRRPTRLLTLRVRSYERPGAAGCAPEAAAPTYGRMDGLEKATGYLPEALKAAPDGGGLRAAIDSSQGHPRAAAAAVRAAAAPRILSPFVLAELDYLLATRVGPAAQDPLPAQADVGADLH